MNRENIFDVLTNAEDNAMEMITDKCPDLTEAQLERLLAKSERKYKIRKREIESRNRADQITMTEYDEVTGVETHRGTWIRMVSTAASLVVAAGVIWGSITFMKRTRTDDINNGGPDDPYASEVVTSTTAVTGTGTGTAYTTIVGGTYTTAAGDKADSAKASASAEAPATTEATTERTESTTEKTTAAQTETTTAAATKSISAEDAELIARANEYHTLAHNQYWLIRTNLGSVMEVDKKPLYDSDGNLYEGYTLNYTYNESGDNIGVLITEPGITTFEDVMNTIGTFDRSYYEEYRRAFTEYNGRVYWLAGQRGSNIFYTGSEVTEITGRTANEIIFKVEDHYDGTNIEGTAPWTEEREFAVAVQPDGSWKVSRFTLPN